MIRQAAFFKTEFSKLLSKNHTASSYHNEVLAADVLHADTPETVVLAIAAFPQNEVEVPHAAQDYERVLIRYAPTALLPGCWLDRCVRVQDSHTALAGKLLDSYYWQIGQGKPALHRGNLYRALCASRGISLPAIEARFFVADKRFCDLDFALPAKLLAIGQFDFQSLPHVLGAHAAMTLWGLPAPVLAAGEKLVGQTFREHFELQDDAQQRARSLLLQMLSCYAQQETPNWKVILATAFDLYETRKRFCESLRPQPKPSPEEAMLELVRRKSQHGFGFHGKIHLAGQPLDRFFAPPDLTGFLRALAKSPWVVAGHPQQSPLLTKTTQFGGSMLGIFEDSELAVIADWIRSLGEGGGDTELTSNWRTPVTSAVANAVLWDFSDETNVETPFRTTEPKTVGQVELPSLYHLFLQNKIPRQTAQLAYGYVKRRIAEVARAGNPEQLVRQKLWPWSISALHEFVESQHREQVFGRKQKHVTDNKMDEQGIERLLSKKQVLWLLCQMAPAAFIDGGWLAGICCSSLNHRPSVAPLFQIYRDELGTGVANYHHGNILRKMLREQGIEFPRCDSAEFIHWPVLLKESFSTPVLWLALSHCTKEFYPEVLGMNLAIELAGIGKAYGRAIALLQQHGIDPTFFKAHNTVDNIDSGHTAWAVRAITLHLQELAEMADEHTLQQCWQRVFVGYAMYGKSSEPLMRALGMQLVPTLGWQWLRHTLLE